MSRPADATRLWALIGGIFAILETGMIWWRVGTLPLFWICLVWAAYLSFLARWAQGRLARSLWLNCAAVIVALGLCEAALWLGERPNPYVLPAGTAIGGTFAIPGFFTIMPAPGIGYRPRASGSATAVKVANGRALYSVRYDVGPDGLRIGAPAAAHPDACLLMFGDSMAWGEGLDDGETTAFLTGQLSQGRVLARNFAFTGYSAHQMLWLVRSGTVIAKAGCDPRRPVIALYQTLPNNIARVAGLRGWDDYGPRYILTGGALRYAGGFDRGQYILRDRLFVPRWLAGPLSRSVVYSRILGRDRRVRDFDLDRFAAVVAAADAGLRRDYPRLRFLAIVWPDLSEPAEPRARQVADLLGALGRRHVSATTIGALVPRFDADPAPFLIAGDGHPNALMNRMLALALRAREPALR